MPAADSSLKKDVVPESQQLAATARTRSRYASITCCIFACNYCIEHTMESEKKKMRSFRGCRGCKSAKRRCTEEKPVCSACAKAGRECQVFIFMSFWWLFADE